METILKDYRNTVLELGPNKTKQMITCLKNIVPLDARILELICQNEKKHWQTNIDLELIEIEKDTENQTQRFQELVNYYGTEFLKNTCWEGVKERINQSRCN